MSHHGQTLGHRPISLITNSFEITQLPTRTYHQYDVFSPELEKKQRIKKIQLIQHLQNSVAPFVFQPQAIYDGEHIMYAPQKLRLANGENATFYVKLGFDGELNANNASDRGVYSIMLTLTRGGQIEASHVNDLIVERRMDSNRALVATNLIQLIVRQAPNMNHTNNGRAYFTGKERSRLPGSGLELWRGVFLSVRPTLGKMVLNVDTCTAAVYQSGRLIDIALQLLRMKDIRDLVLSESSANFKKLERFLKNLQCKVTTMKGKTRTKTIRGLIPNAGEFEFFNDTASQTMTVATYFQMAHGSPVRYPRIVGIRLTGKKNPHQVIIPMEFCEIEGGQLFKRKIPEEYTSDMVKFSTMRPQERLRKITDAAKESVHSMFIQDSGMRLEASPLSVNGKLLNVPSVFFNPSASRLDIRNGAWNAVRQTLTDPKTIRAWMIVSFITEIQIKDSMIQDIMTCCSNLGMRVTAKPFVANANPYSPGRALTDYVSEYMKRLNIAENQVEDFLSSLIVIVLLPKNSAAIRGAVKHWGDVDKGIATQCLRQGKFEGARDQYWNNIVLKINARLGGTNFHADSPVVKELRNEPYMIIGADVGHPGPGVQKPSVTGLVYSHDRFATQYVAITGVQSPRVERIEKLGQYVQEAVDNFGKKNQAVLRRIIFYRDGISEGEFNNVAEAEIAEIKKAFEVVWTKRGVTGPRPKLTYIVVGKRHHAVFFPSDKSGEDGRTGNSFAGSLIDSGITHPKGQDFYLQSHSAIQGTCRSSHYTVLHDENWNHNLTKIQELSYTLCHVYAKATRSVSIPAPVYYADLVCSRGQFHVDPNATLQFEDNDNASVSSGPLDLTNWEAAFRPVHGRLSKSMYFL